MPRVAHHQHHHLHDVPLRRRLVRFLLVSILIVMTVMIVQTVVLYLAMPKSSKATHHARAACGSFVKWIEQDGASAGSAEATATLRKATDSAQSAASLAPERWSALLEDFRAAAPADEVQVAGPGIVTPRERAISSALETCNPIAGNRDPSAS